MERRAHYEARIAQLRAEAEREARKAAKAELLLTAATLEAKMKRLWPEAA